MDTILNFVCIPFGILMKWCWQLVGNYGAAILLFTLATKLILLPLSVWVHKNSILMVKIQPEMNFIKARFFGDADMIADEQSKLFKKHKYRPAASLIPLAVQIILLMAVIGIIYEPMDYILGISPSVTHALGESIGVNFEDSAWQISVIRAVQDGRAADANSAILNFDTSFLGLDLSVTPSSVWGIYTLVPIVAGISAWLLCLTQNLSNVIQHEQSAYNKYGLMAVSVGISLYLGCFVPSGIALYWVASNLLSIAQMYALNLAIPPKKHVDYEALERSRAALKELDSLDSAADKKQLKLNKKREKQDYKRFFGIVNKHLVIYSEGSGFYKYFKDIIAELHKRSNIVVHYVTNDPDDAIFEVVRENPRIKPYYVSMKKTVTLMMKLEADMVLMTTPEFNKLYLKRSFMKKDIEYVYVPHDTMSVHMGFTEGALDEFDTIFCTGPHTEREIRATEAHYGLKEKTLVRFGYPLSDELKRRAVSHTPSEGGRRRILIAPSWQEDNLLDSCIDELIEGLLCDEYAITVRPHPEYIKRYGDRMQRIVDRYSDRVGDGLTFELDFSDSSSIYSSDLLITDWSGIAPEFCFATGRPAIFVNTEIKCRNPNWRNIGLEPVEIGLRNKLGIALDKQQLSDVKRYTQELLDSREEYAQRIENAFEEHLFNHGNSAAAGAKYILSRLTSKG